MSDPDQAGRGDSEREGEGVIEDSWERDKELIKAILDGDRDALERLYLEKLAPVVAAHGRLCPPALVKRFYQQAGLCLVQLINGSDQLTMSTWSSEVVRMQNNLADQLRSAEWDWLRVIMARAGSIAAEDELLVKYDQRIRKLASWLGRDHPEIEDDLAQSGRIAFRDTVISKCDPDRGTTIWEYATTILRREMYAAIRDWMKPKLPVSSDPLYRRVNDAIRKLRKNQPSQDPSDEEIAELCGASPEEVHEVRRRHMVLSLNENLHGEEGADMEAADHESDPYKSLFMRERYDACVNYLNRRGKDSAGQNGMRWLVLFVLREYEGYTWDEIICLLEGSKTINWQLVHDLYLLPYSVPTDWSQICLLFGPDKLALTAANFRQWYPRRMHELQSGLDRSDLLEER